MSGKGIILAVDDTPESLLMLTDMLGAEGYDVRPADSGELALASVASGKPELILLDIRMPGIDGFEVCRRLKSAKQTRDIPIMFISAITETEERVQGFRLGAVDFVSKPFRKEELLARIEAHLELSRLRMRLEQRVTERTEKLRAANERLQAELAERTRAEQALRESEARFQTMADAAAVFIWTSGPDTEINFCNRHILDFTGRTLKDLAVDGWKGVVHPEDLEVKYPNYVPLIQAHRAYQVEYRARRADGEYRWVLDTATPRFVQNGEFAGYIGIGIDITDLKRNQEQLSAAQKLESLGVLVSGVSHKFNNVLGTIVAEADLALSDLPPGSAARESVERINAVTIRASEMVALLMAYARGGEQGTPSLLSLSAIVDETVRLFKATGAKNAELRVSLAAKLPPIHADLSQIRQVVMNLLTNAWEALPNGDGLIGVDTSLVRVDPAADAALSSWKAPPGDYVRLKVTDSGCGIPDDAKTSIFDPFYTTKFLGRGLGLSAVLGIVRSLGGTVEVRSTVGQGSIFEVHLPCYREAPIRDA